MGLNVIEFIMEVEETFDIRFTDEEAEKIPTPRDLKRFLHARLGLPEPIEQRPTTPTACRTQHAFYRLRTAIADVVGAPRSAIRTDSRWKDLLPWWNRYFLRSQILEAAKSPSMTFASIPPHLARMLQFGTGIGAVLIGSTLVAPLNLAFRIPLITALLVGVLSLHMVAEKVAGLDRHGELEPRPRQVTVGDTARHLA